VLRRRDFAFDNNLEPVSIKSSTIGGGGEKKGKRPVCIHYLKVNRSKEVGGGGGGGKRGSHLLSLRP